MMKTDDELAAFVATWNAKLRRFQRAHPARWHVRGWSDDEVRDAITLRLIESHAEVTTEEVAWSVARARLAELRRAHRIRSTPVDLRGMALAHETTTPEDRVLAREADAHRTIAGERAESRLTLPQRRWLDAMRIAAGHGEFFATSDRLNLSAASRLLGKNRSSAQRAFDALRLQYARERDRLDD